MKVLKKIIILISAVCMTSCGQNIQKQNSILPQVTGEFIVSVLKVGKADAIVLQTANHSVIIDCGEADDSKEILKYLSKNDISKIDCMFITHFDKDHVGGAADILNNIETEQIITPLYEGSNDEYCNYIKAAKENNITPLTLTENMTFILDDVLFEIYPPQKSSYKESDNDFSLAISAKHGNNSFLFTGDAEAERLSEILRQTNEKYAFLKVPHHGQRNKNTQKFIERINPSYSVITCSEKNTADTETINILESVGSAVYLTENGNVKAVSDGKNISITQKGAEK